MRLRSHHRLDRSVALRLLLGALLAALALVPSAGAARLEKGDRGVFVSKGVGRQVFAGGGGVAYGVVFSGASLVVVDYSPARDMKVDAPVVPTGGTSRVAFRISGTLYRVTVTGASTFTAAGVFGRLQVRGKGTLSVSGARSKWNVPAINFGRVPKDVRKLFQFAASGQPVPAPPPPPDPPPPPATTTTTTG